jgi:hypothetical protein
MPIVSPEMELKAKNLNGKAFRFGIFWDRDAGRMIGPWSLIGNGN